MVTVPCIALYAARPRVDRRTVGALLIVTLAGITAASIVFLGRVYQREGHHDTFAARELHAAPVPLSGLLPLYFGMAFPFEAERELFAAVPSRHSYGFGTFTLQGLPDAFFPSGKVAYPIVVADVTHRDPQSTPYWTVASYQGRALVDFGAAGVVLVSVVVGLLFGCAYRTARGRSGLYPLVVIGYCAYLAAFSFYDNLLSISVMSIAYDLAVLKAIDALVRSDTGEPATEPRLERGRGNLVRVETKR
jgi:hypothetical protein